MEALKELLSLSQKVLVKLFNNVGYFVSIFSFAELQAVVDPHGFDSSTVEEHSALRILRLF